MFISIASPDLTRFIFNYFNLEFSSVFGCSFLNLQYAVNDCIQIINTLRTGDQVQCISEVINSYLVQILRSHIVVFLATGFDIFLIFEIEFSTSR